MSNLLTHFYLLLIHSSTPNKAKPSQKKHNDAVMAAVGAGSGGV
jgi:hypothetical protein